QLHRDSVLEKLFDQGSIEFCLPRPYQQREADRLVPDDREVNLRDIFEVNEHMIHRGRKMSDGRHKSLQDRLEDLVEDGQSWALTLSTGAGKEPGAEWFLNSTPAVGRMPG